jgi:hypothetical protein
VKAVAPVDGLTVTFLVAVVVPQRPVDVAVIVAAPKKAAFQFITPVAALIVPAAAGATEYVTEVLFTAVATYVSSAASWQRITAPEIKLVAPVDGLTVTILVALVVPQSPVDVAVIVAAPKNAGSQSMIPVAAPMLPAAAGDTLYVTEVLLRAVAVYVSSAAFWHTVTAPAVKVVAPVDGLTVTALVALVVPQSPVEVAVIVAAPEKAASQFMTPVAALIVPAAAGATE